MSEKIRPFDKKFYQELLNEGLSPAEAGYVAGAEMDWSPERKGDVNARQTYCHILNTRSYFKSSKGRTEGRIKTKKDLNNFLREQGLPVGNEGVEEWIRRQEKKKK